MKDLQNQINDLKAQLDSVKNGDLTYIGIEYIKHSLIEGTKVNTSGSTPIFTAQHYGGVGNFDFSCTNAPDMVLVLNIGGKRYWLPAFNPS